MDRVRNDGAIETPPALAAALARSLLEAVGAEDAAGVLDPACGNGELLVAVARQRDADAAWVARHLFGIELRRDRASAARTRLLAAVGADPRSELGRAIARNVGCADALDPRVPWPQRTHVVANPPWVSLSGRQAGHLSPERLELYRRSWPAFAGWPSLHGAFLERIARHLAGWRGHARVLVPAAVCDLDGYGSTRAAVDADCVLESAPGELGERAFRGVTQPAVLLALRGREEPARGSPRTWCDRTDSAARELSGALERFPRLPARSFADPGAHTGNAARELVHDEPAPGRAPVRVGRDLNAFRLAPARRFVRTDLPRTDGRVFRVPTLERCGEFPVLVRQTASRPVAALHQPPTRFRNSLLACRDVPDLDPAFVVAVLNGPVAGAWHRLRFRDARQRAFPQVKVGHLATQPFPIARRADSARLHDEVAEHVRALAQLDERAFRVAVAELEERVLAAFGLGAELEELARCYSASSSPASSSDHSAAARSISSPPIG